MSILIAILVFGVLIMVHELGHFLVAKGVGIQVDEFAIGMGPLIFGKTVGETKYSLRLLPIGGFNKMAGMEPGEENHPKGFNSKSIGKRIAVIAAGSLMNILLALVLFVILFTLIGVAADSNIVGEVSFGSPAAEAGILPGDQIIAIDGERIETWTEMVAIIHPNPDKELTLTILRDGQEVVTRAIPILDKENNVGLIGISQSTERVGFFEAIVLGTKNTIAITLSILVGLVNMITGKVPAEVAGPIGIVSIIGNVARMGFANIISFTALLSLNLGLINLFPIPALDGSRLVFLGVEGLRGKPVAPEKENLIHLVGFALLIMLMVIITYKDILRLIG